MKKYKEILKIIKLMGTFGFLMFVGGLLALFLNFLPLILGGSFIVLGIILIAISGFHPTQYKCINTLGEIKDVEKTYFYVVETKKYDGDSVIRVIGLGEVVDLNIFVPEIPQGQVIKIIKDGDQFRIQNFKLVEMV